GKPVHLRLTSANWRDLLAATELARTQFEGTAGLIDVEDTRPLPGIDWQIDVDVEKAGRFGADVATVGAMVQLVTRGLKLDTMRVDSSDEEIDIRVRLPEQDRLLSTLDTLRVRTTEGLVPLANFISRQPVPKLGQIDRVDAVRYFDVKANVIEGQELYTLSETVVETDEAGVETSTTGTRAVMQLLSEGVEARDPAAAVVRSFEPGFIGALLGAKPTYNNYALVWSHPDHGDRLQDLVDSEADPNAESTFGIAPLNANERVAFLTEWLEAETNWPETVSFEWTGDQEEQAESQAFLGSAFIGALGLMFVILLAQFNSVYNSVLVLIAVVLSVTGCLIGMLVMDQTFSIIMTGTGIVALAGIVVNNNIVLIDTYQEYSKYMPRIEAITRTAEARIRPVLLTTITTMAGLAPMMFGLSVDFFGGGYTIDAPTSLWWKQLATAVVFGLGLATVLTLVVTPALLAVRVWAAKGAYGVVAFSMATIRGSESRLARDRKLAREARRSDAEDVQWIEEQPVIQLTQPIFMGKPRAAE
ncbi:MAG: efflux RND transporter permease subunit, partial [Pseudomonadota bacterium]